MASAAGAAPHDSTMIRPCLTRVDGDSCFAFAWLAGNITFQLEHFDVAVNTILPTVLDVIELHMANEEALEPSMWALANVYFCDSLDCTDRVVTLLGSALRVRDL